MGNIIEILDLIIVLSSSTHFCRCVYRYGKHQVKPSNMDILVMLYFIFLLTPLNN